MRTKGEGRGRIGGGVRDKVGEEEGVAEAGEQIKELEEMGVDDVQPLTHSSTSPVTLTHVHSHTPLTEEVPYTLEQEPNRNTGWG